MKEIIQKINQLQWASRMPQKDYLQPGDGPLDDFLRKTQVLDTMFDELKVLAREAGTVVGRRVSFQVMDSLAHYVVTHVLKNNKVAVQWVEYDEDYIDGRLGERGVLELKYIEDITSWQDQLEGVR